MGCAMTIETTLLKIASANGALGSSLGSSLASTGTPYSSTFLGRRQCAAGA
jgi:hypothetical protein